MPNLLTVIAELSSTAFSSTCKFGTAGTSKCDHGISWTIKRGKRVLLTEVFFIYTSKLKRAARAAEAARKAVDTRSWHRAASTVPYHLNLSHAYCYYGRLRLHRNTPINTTLLCPTFNGSTESTDSTECNTWKFKVRKQRWFRKAGEQNQKRCSSNLEEVTASEAPQVLWAHLSGTVSLNQDDPYHRSSSTSCYPQGRWHRALQQLPFCWLSPSLNAAFSLKNACLLFKLLKYWNNRVSTVTK